MYTYIYICNHIYIHIDTCIFVSLVSSKEEGLEAPWSFRLGGFMKASQEKPSGRIMARVLSQSWC